jgi:predicted O-linked N-acetylglucosamine transferase (SPINDLY family)
MSTYYENLNKKLDRLQLQKQQPKFRKQPNHSDQQLHPRVRYLTSIQFDDEELRLLKNGLNYSIEKPKASYFTNLIAETERAIKLLDVKMQNTYRFLATKKLKQISMAANHNTAQKIIIIIKN